MSINKKIIEAEATPPAPPAPPADSFNVLLYTGDRPTNAPKTGVGFQPDLIFIKGRTQNDFWSVLDSSRGANVLSCDAAQAESSFSGFTFDSDGFTVGSSGQANSNGTSYVSYHWRANGGTTSSNTDGSITTTVQAKTDAGFSIITYTGDGASTSTIGHGLSSAPEFVVIKTRSDVSNWPVYHTGLTNASYRLVLDTDAAENTTNNPWNSTAPTSSVIHLGSSGNVNISGRTFVAYAFHSVSGFSDFGSYSGNNTGQTITTGFQPDFLMLKKTNTTSEWWVMDSVRGTTNNLEVNTPDAENTGISGAPTFVSTGFNFSGSTFNETGTDWIYIAFKISS